MEIFYVPELSAGEVTLDKGESTHCTKVLRKKTGDKVMLTDGYGTMCKGQILDDDSLGCIIQIEERYFHYKKLSYKLNLIIAPVKSRDRFEWFLEKATEIGVTSVQPIICERSERKAIRMDRMENVVLSAMKQSLKAYKPILYKPISFLDWIHKDHAGKGYIAHCMEGEKEQVWKLPPAAEYNILIGPEGDFSPVELEHATSKGFLPLSLGETRLRTETAGIMACSAISFINS